MNLKWFGLIAIVVIAGSFAWNGLKTPVPTENEYIAKYRILNVTDKTDTEILKEREDINASSQLWKKSNKELAEELEKRGIEHNIFKAQYHVDELLYFYSDLNVSAFVDKQYPKGK